MGSPLITDANAICRKSRKIGGRQRAICDKERDVVETIADGVKLAFAECQFQFRERHWNCTTSHRTFARILKYGKPGLNIRGVAGGGGEGGLDHPSTQTYTGRPKRKL